MNARNLLSLTLVVLLLVGCGCEASPTPEPTKPAEPSQPVTSTTPTPEPATISIEEAEAIVSACQERGEAVEVGLSDGSTLVICRPEALDPGELILVGAAQVITLADIVPGDEVVVGIKSAHTIARAVVIGGTITAPYWVPLLEAVKPEIVALVFGEQATVVEGVQTDAEERAPARATPTSRRIGYCEDEPNIANPLMAYLSRMLGWEFTWYVSCEQLLAAMASGTRYDGYLIDFNLAGEKNGIECIAQIKILDPGKPAVLMSGRDLSEQYDPFFQKPVSAKELGRFLASLF